MIYKLSFLFGSEIRFATLLIGMIEFVWSFMGIAPPPDNTVFARTLESSGLGDAWYVVMFCVGLVTMAGAVFPWRRGRHIGLFLSTLIWLTMFGIFWQVAPWTPVVMTMPILGLFPIGLMYADAKRKRREKLAP